MNTLAVDIGGTKLAVALFQGERMIKRESRPTNREGAREIYRIYLTPDLPYDGVLAKEAEHLGAAVDKLIERFGGSDNRIELLGPFLRSCNLRFYF